MGLEKFKSSLDLLLGFNVNLYIGEDVFNGKLIGVETDHIIMEDENNYVFYYSIDQIQAITKNTKLFKSEEPTTNFLKTQSLTEVLNSFRHSWVSILCVNKQKFNGILSQVDEDFATLIDGEERILIKISQISNILKGYYNEEATNTDSTNASSQSHSENDNNSKAESAATSKESNTKSENKSENKSEKKSDSSSNEDSSHSAISPSNKEKTKEQQEVTAKIDEIELNNTMIWSQPIKIESTMVQTKDDVSTNIIRIKKSQVNEKDAAKTSNDMDEARSSKPQANDESKEMKPVKETATIEKTDNNPAPPFKIQMNEGKSIKTQETAKSAASTHQTSKNTETVKSSASPHQTSKNTETVKTVETTTIWKQKEPEQKVFRFVGEPGNPENQKAFPFAGWPNRNNRTTRF
jgi:hypothetical protein